MNATFIARLIINSWKLVIFTVHFFKNQKYIYFFLLLILMCDTYRKYIFLSLQIARLAECGRMLVAVELSSWLNNVEYSLQAVVLCYGLIAPLIYHKIPSEPLIQVSMI